MMTTETKQLSHLDYADAAEAAERGRSWPQAAILWRRAMDTLTSATTPSRKNMRHASRYTERLEACERLAEQRASVRHYAFRNFSGSDTGHGTATCQPEGGWLMQWSFGSAAGGHVCDDGESYSAVVTSDPDEFFSERGFVRT